MSVTLIPAGLAALLENPDGPVGRYVTEIADFMVGEAQKNVRDYFHTAPTLNVDQDVASQREGDAVAVGIRDAGSKSRRLAEGAIEGRLRWLREAFDQTRQRFVNG